MPIANICLCQGMFMASACLVHSLQKRRCGVPGEYACESSEALCSSNREQVCKRNDNSWIFMPSAAGVISNHAQLFDNHRDWRPGWPFRSNHADWWLGHSVRHWGAWHGLAVAPLDYSPKNYDWSSLTGVVHRSRESEYMRRTTTSQLFLATDSLQIWLYLPEKIS